MERTKGKKPSPDDRVTQWLNTPPESRDNLSWATRADLRNLVCSIFTRAENWDRVGKPKDNLS